MTKKEIGIKQPKGTWVQTERKAHEAWAKLGGTHPRSAQLMHFLVANMDKQGALVISQKTLASMMECSVDTVKRALNPLKKDNWIEVVRIGSSKGGANAYIVNRRVAWADKRENQRYAIFDARIVVSSSEQEELIENQEKLKKLPTMGFSEIQLPSGDGEDPPSQQILPEMLPDIPALKSKEDDQIDIEELIQIKSKNK